MTFEYRTMRSVRSIGVLAALLLVPFYSPAFAEAAPNASDVESGRALYKEGIALRRSGDEKGALIKLLAAHDLAHTPVTGLELGKCHIALGQFVEGVSVLKGVVSMPEFDETERTQKARKEAKALADQIQPKLSALSVTITGVPAGQTASLSVDGVVVPPAAMGLPRTLNPGKHTITVSAAGVATQTQEVSLVEGQRATTEVSLVSEKATTTPSAIPTASASAAPTIAPLAPTEKSRPAQPASSGRPLRTAGWVTGASGLALLGVGGILGLVAKSKYSSSDAGCTGTTCSNQDSVEQSNKARSIGNAATVVVTVGAAALLTGGGLVLFAPSSKRDAAKVEAGVVGPWGAFVRGSF